MADKIGQAAESKMSFNFDQQEFEKHVQSVPKISKDKLFEKKNLQLTMRYMDMANALYHESEKYDTYQERFNHLFEKYEELFIKMPGMFQAAINRNLYQGEVGKVVRAFQNAKGAPEAIYKNMDKYNNDIVDKAITSIDAFRNTASLADSEQSRINSMIEMHKQSKADTKPQ